MVPVYSDDAGLLIGRVSADPNLLRGGCLIRAGKGLVDVRTGNPDPHEAIDHGIAQRDPTGR